MVYEVTSYIFRTLLPCMILGFFIGNVIWVISTVVHKKRQVEREIYAHEYAAKQERLFWHNMRYFMFADSTRYTGECRILFSRLRTIRQWMDKLYEHGYRVSPLYVSALLVLACSECPPNELRWLIPGTRDGMRRANHDVPEIVKYEHATMLLDGVSLDLNREGRI